MQKKVFCLISVFMMNAIIGCTVLKMPTDDISNGTPSPSKRPGKKKPSYSSATPVETQLLLAAQSIEQSLGVLAAAETAERPPILNTEPLITEEGGMGGVADVDWTGPIGPLVEKIALMTNYRVKTLGNEPAIPILISINVKRSVIADILQNASLQAGKRAHILVFPSSRLIEVRYVS